MSRQTGRFSGKPVGGRPPFPAAVRNGRIPLSLLGRCETQHHAAHPLLYRPAALAFDALTRAARQDGVTIEAVALYRDYASQVERRAYWAARGKPGNAARPGTSNHGWGVAADVNRHLPGVVDWLKRNATRYGWDSPMWAMDGRGTEESWHWEFIAGMAVGDDLPEVPVYVAGKLLPEADAYRDEGLIYVALRPVAEALGWSVEAQDGHAHLTLSATAHADIEYELRDGRGFVPVRKLEVKIGVPVTWKDGAVWLA